MLMQDFNLFEETVAENITLTQDKQSPEAIYNKMPFNDLKDRIGKLPNKLDTILGSWFGDGINLSKGQLQMLALSRIFYKDCDCYILDEPNSALDPRSEKYLFEYIQKKLKDKMCIITLHVFTNIDITDRVLMFEKGKIICEGHHLKLYKENEKYQEFYNLQERTLEENK